MKAKQASFSKNLISLERDLEDLSRIRQVGPAKQKFNCLEDNSISESSKNPKHGIRPLTRTYQNGKNL